MDRNRDARRATMAASNGLARRRHRSGIRDSPDEDGVMEIQETARLRDRGSGKKDRDRDRERDRLSWSKRRRGERLMPGSNRDDLGDATSEESVNDEEEDDVDDGGGAVAASMRMLPPNPSVALSSSSMSNHHRKSFLPPLKVLRAAPTWKVADEMIGVSVPRKARSASKRSNGVGIGGEQNHCQTSTSPGRPSLAVASTPVSPSSSNTSVRKKMKTNGQKSRPPKSSSKLSSSAQDEIEFEIAEVLYGMMRQPLSPPKQEVVANESTKISREPNKSSNDAKSRISSPISSPSNGLTQLSSNNLLPNSIPANAPTATVAPKRKRLRPVTCTEENPSTFTDKNTPGLMTNKSEIDQTAHIKSNEPNFEKLSGSAAENHDLGNSQVAHASSELEGNPKLMTEESEIKEMDMTKEEEQSPKKESTVRLNGVRENMTVSKANSAISWCESQQENKFQIDLMASPPSRLSPKMVGEIDFVAVDPKPMVTSMEAKMKPDVKEDEKNVIKFKEGIVSTEAEEKKVKVTGEEVKSQKPIGSMERMIDLQLDLEKTERNSGNNGVSSNKLNKHVGKQQLPSSNTENTGAMSMPMSVATWPGGLSPMGYMAPLQGVLSTDGSNIPSTSIKPCTQRSATHCYIARNICYHQQFTRMNPFWPAATGPASLYGAKASNLNLVSSMDLHGNKVRSSVNTNVEKGQGLAIFPSHSGKEKGSQTPNILDNAQRKQVMLQPALPPGAPSNILQGPAFIFPLSQQQAAAVTSIRPGPAKSPPNAGVRASSPSNTASVGAPATPAVAATAMSFNYPNMPGNETQYLAILQNNGFPYPIPAHVGAPPAYRGSHAHGMPFFNGSFYSSQMLHPSQVQQQSPATQSMQNQHGHQNTSISSGSLSAQKLLQNQQHRPHGGGNNGGSGSLPGFPAPKNQSSQQLQQQQQQRQNQTRQLETEMGSYEDIPSTADSRVSRANMSINGQNFAIPLHSPNFSMMTPALLNGANGAVTASGNHGDKKHQRQQFPQQQGSKTGIEAVHSQAFAMSFPSISGSNAPVLDISSFSQNHAIFQSLPESTRHNFHTIGTNAVMQAAQQKKSYRVSEEGKGDGGDSSIMEERNSKAPPATVGQTIAFSRPDVTDSASAIPSSVIDSSAQNLNLASAPTRAPGSAMPTTISTVNISNSQQQLQRTQQHQHLQMPHLHKQHQIAAAAHQSNTAATSNGNAYSENFPSSSMAGKFSTLSTFPQNLVQSSSSPGQSTQWKISDRMTTSQVTSESHVPLTPSSLKNLPQQKIRPHQNQAQISFAAKPKSSTTQQGKQPPSSNMSSPPPVVVSSPTTSVSKSSGGSPMATTSTSSGSKVGLVSSSSNQHARNSSPVRSNKSSRVGGRNISSILSNASATAPGAVPKPHLSQQQQQQLPKQALQQAQMFFNNYMQAQATHSSSTTSGASGTRDHYFQRRQQQQPQGSQASSSSNGMLSLCTPVTLVNASISDPTKSVVTTPASGNMKGGGVKYVAPSMSTNIFPYPQIIPNAVQVKPTEQKQPAGD